MKKLLLTLCLTAATMVVSAEEVTLTAPKLEPKLTYGESMGYRPELSLNLMKVDANAMMAIPAAANKSTRWTWMQSNPGVKPYKVMDDLTFVGIPLFAAGWAIKGDKAMFAQNNKNKKKNTQLLTDFKTGIDDYTQYFGPVMTVGLKLGGYEGRSSWGRLLASAGMSYAIMAGFVNGIKYTAKEMRPDGSTANSWPSGHTATSFVGATLLHKEYGLTRSPWFSVAGYGVATATGVMRILNNRHWISDVMSGAGIGIMSTEIGYALSDLIFKGKGLLRNDLEMNPERPSFFSISMGLGLGSKDIDFGYSGLQNKEMYDENLYDLDAEDRVRFRAATVVDAEGAYFFNKYVGVGGRFRVRAMSAKSFGQYANITSEDNDDAWEYLIGSPFEKARAIEPEQEPLNTAAVQQNGAAVTRMGGIVQSDHLTEFTASAGLYLNLPLNKHFSLGTKFLIGRSINQDLEIDGYADGYVKDADYGMVVVNNDLTYMLIEQPHGVQNADGSYKTYSTEWDYLTIGANNSTSLGTGLSLTYRYKSNFSWRLYVDYDYTKKTYTMTVNPYEYMKTAIGENLYGLISNPKTSDYYAVLNPIVYKKTKKMNYVTLGLSFLVNL
jgi:membrane-associated phospholipid phosphatase